MRTFQLFLLFFLFMGTRLSEAGITDQECIQCHASITIARTVHENFSCVDCHSGIQELPHNETALVECKNCHEEAQEKYGKGRHGIAAAKDDFDAALCSDCHGAHDIRAANDEKSTVNPKNQIKTCAVCHANPKVAKRHTFTTKVPVEAYKNSVHFKALNEDGKKAPSCADCHGSHEVRHAGDQASSINWKNVSETCGKCHAEIMKVYQGSIHGKAAAAGGRQAPVCTDCHGEHEIRAPGDPKSSVYPAQIAKTTCVWCHESLRVTQKFSLPGERLSTYLSSYHGLVNQAGSGVVANCASCHGIHDIRPSSDSESTIHPSNLPRTCGKCHPGVGGNVALGAIHIDPSRKEGNKVVYYVRLFYIFLIFFAVALMLLHNGMDLARKFRSERLPDGKDYLRFTMQERLQHAAMSLSFMVLAYSGFALAYPQAWWPAPFSFTGGTEEERRLVHRIAALAIVCALSILYYIIAFQYVAGVFKMRRSL
ncbi:MAG: hypothetical protein HZA01_06985 [Nitrospinae bacterium]|nr:hypothetical protein [Nitrospinota bacterium]